MAKRNQFSIDWSQFEKFTGELEKYGANLKGIFTEVMEMEAETLQEDVREATSKAHLPASGKYSQGETEKTIDLMPRTEWTGMIASIGLGFDKSKPNAGTFLITGTPRMRPDYELEKIFVNKKYQKQMVADIYEYFEGTLEDFAKGRR